MTTIVNMHPVYKLYNINILVPISDGGEYTVQTNEDTDIPLDGSASLYIRTLISEKSEKILLSCSKHTFYTLNLI